MIHLDLDALEALTPNAAVTYRLAFDRVDALRPFGVLDSALRAQHFLAQALHETGGLRVIVENMNYSAARLVEVWPSRFKTIDDAKPFEHNPRRLANRVYGNRMGNVGPDDGWRYIGRGLLQLTGRASYQRAGAALGVDFVNFPDLVVKPAHALAVAGYEWMASHCNDAADANDVDLVTRRINGGSIGLAERRVWLQRVRAGSVVVDDAAHREEEGGTN